jgi:hypothetical protein
MNIAPTESTAAARSGHIGKFGMLRALVLGTLLAGAALSGASASAMGEQRDRGDQRDRGEQHDQRDQRERPQAVPQQQPREAPQRDARPFDTRLEEARRQQAQPQQDTGGRRGGRLTPDERRELRRQINEAGMDLYPNTPRR